MATPDRIRRRGGRRRSGGGFDEPTPGSAADLTRDADPESVARAIALRQLTTAPRTRAQLSDAMARRGVPDDVAETVLDRFEEVRLVDDEDFARQWVETRHAGRGLSRRALRHELRERGVAEQTVDQAVERIDGEAELEAARQLVRRRLAGMRGDDPVRRTRRLAGMLARKGYGTEVAFRAIRDITGEMADQLDGAAGDVAGADD